MGDLYQLLMLQLGLAGKLAHSNPSTDHQRLSVIRQKWNMQHVL